MNLIKLFPYMIYEKNRDCYVNKLAPKCKRCQGAIVENFISALDAYWHPGCFVCQVSRLLYT